MDFLNVDTSRPANVSTPDSSDVVDGTARFTRRDGTPYSPQEEAGK